MVLHSQRRDIRAYLKSARGGGMVKVHQEPERGEFESEEACACSRGRGGYGSWGDWSD